MPRPRKPARLWLEPERLRPNGTLKSAAGWVVRDGDRKVRTGCGPHDVAGANKFFSDYLARTHAEAEPEPNLAAGDILIADVLRYYAEDTVTAGVARPKEFVARMNRLLDWWGEKYLSYVTGFSCKAYVKHRKSESGARRELEDFRAAIKLYRADGLCRDDVVVTLPQKHMARVDHFDRSQVAALLWHCWTAREMQKGVATDKRHLRHVVPFILTAVYTGSRSARIWQASFEQQEGLPFLDLDSGIYYRTPIGVKAARNKRAGSIQIPDRLLTHMRRWREGVVVDGVRRPRDYLVEWQGRPADPKRALASAMAAVFGENHPYVRHTFRHTCATWLCWSGAEIRNVAKYLSMTEEMVVEVYGHHHPHADRLIGEMFSSGKAGRLVGRSRRERETDGERKGAARLLPSETPGTKRQSKKLKVA